MGFNSGFKGLISYLPKIVYTLNSWATPLRKYRQITSGQAFTWQESTKRWFPRIPCALYNTTIHHATSGYLSPSLSLSISLSLSPLPVTSRSEPVSHQLLSLFSRFVLMLHCFAMLQSQCVNIFSLYISERERERERSFFLRLPSSPLFLINTHSLLWAYSV